MTTASLELAGALPQELLEQVRKLSAPQLQALRELLDTGTQFHNDLKTLLTQRWNDFQSGKTPALTVEEQDKRLQQLAAELRK